MKQTAVVIIALSIIVVIIFALFIVTTIYYSQNCEHTHNHSNAKITGGDRFIAFKEKLMSYDDGIGRALLELSNLPFYSYVCAYYMCVNMHGVFSHEFKRYRRSLENAAMILDNIAQCFSNDAFVFKNTSITKNRIPLDSPLLEFQQRIAGALNSIDLILQNIYNFDDYVQTTRTTNNATEPFYPIVEFVNAYTTLYSIQSALRGTALGSDNTDLNFVEQFEKSEPITFSYDYGEIVYDNNDGNHISITDAVNIGVNDKSLKPLDTAFVYNINDYLKPSLPLTMKFADDGENKDTQILYYIPTPSDDDPICSITFNHEHFINQASDAAYEIRGFTESPCNLSIGIALLMLPPYVEALYRLLCHQPTAEELRNNVETANIEDYHIDDSIDVPTKDVYNFLYRLYLFDGKGNIIQDKFAVVHTYYDSGVCISSDIIGLWNVKSKRYTPLDLYTDYTGFIFGICDVATGDVYASYNGSFRRTDVLMNGNLLIDVKNRTVKSNTASKSLSRDTNLFRNLEFNNIRFISVCNNFLCRIMHGFYGNLSYHGINTQLYIPFNSAVFDWSIISKVDETRITETTEQCLDYVYRSIDKTVKFSLPKVYGDAEMTDIDGQNPQQFRPNFSPKEVRQPSYVPPPVDDAVDDDYYYDYYDDDMPAAPVPPPAPKVIDFKPQVRTDAPPPIVATDDDHFDGNDEFDRPDDAIILPEPPVATDDDEFDRPDDAIILPEPPAEPPRRERRRRHRTEATSVSRRSEQIREQIVKDNIENNLLLADARHIDKLLGIYDNTSFDIESKPESFSGLLIDGTETKVNPSTLCTQATLAMEINDVIDTDEQQM